MSTYKENDNTQEPIAEFINILKEMGKSSSTYRDYAEKTVKQVMGEEAKAVSRIINGFDESGLAKSGLKMKNQQLFIYRLFELKSGHVFCKPFLDKVAKTMKAGRIYVSYNYL